jgi:predicted HTH transcriptional regulator
MLEFKNYNYSLDNPVVIEALLKIICAFLNKAGGVILIGVGDDKIVKGIHLTAPQFDETRRFINNSIFIRFDP